MADISKIQLPNGDEYNLTDKNSGYITGMTILSYGKSTWADFIAAYTANKVVYCRASSNSNPASGSQTRLAFMAYVSNAESPTNVEFQYYRSVNAHSDSQQGDQVYVYKLTSSGSWTVTVREAYTKIVAGGDLTSVWADGALTISADLSGKQDLLVSGTNIKTVNSESLLGSGNIDIEGVPHVNLTQAEYDELTPEEKNNGDIYFITDSDDGGGPVSQIIGTGTLDTDAQTLIGAVNELADNDAVKNGTFTKTQDGMSVYLSIKERNGVVTINGFLNNVTLTANTSAKLGTISGVGLPGDGIACRTICSVGANAYTAGTVSYLTLTTDGEMHVTSSNGGSGKSIYFTLAYVTG